MATPAFIAGDWGTSNLRLSLCSEDGTALAERSGPGVATLNGALEPCFSALAADWDRGYGTLPSVLCGMAGSTLGWREVPYLAAPADPDAIADAALRFTASSRSIAILPGVSCRNRLGAPDVMRGEETQIAGAFSLAPELREGLHVLCLPGTHTKWVVLEDGTIQHFLTGITGELFEILHRYSVLAGQTAPQTIHVSPPFLRALEQTRLYPEAELVHLLFQARSRPLCGDMPPENAGAFLSGLVVGQDVSGAMRVLHNTLRTCGDIVVIGSPALCQLYAAAFETRGISSQSLDGGSASLAGLAGAYRQIFSRAATDAD